MHIEKPNRKDFERMTELIEKWIVDNKHVPIENIGRIWNQWNYQNQNEIPYLRLNTKYNSNTLEWDFVSKITTSREYTLHLTFSELHARISVYDHTTNPIGPGEKFIDKYIPL